MNRAVFAFALGAALVASAPALANGRFPAANQLVVTPGKPDALVLRTTFGVLFSNDAGKTWDWVCERAVGYGGVWDPPIAAFANGTVIAGTIDGLAVSPDHGCAWGFAKGALEKHAVVDVVVRPDAPNEGFVLASTSSGIDDAGASLFKTEVLATTDAAATSTALASSDFDPSFVAQTIEVAKSDRKRVYVSGTIGPDGELYVSSDGGASFTKHALDLAKPDERAPFIAAVSPTDANRVYVRTGGRSSRLLVTDDGGLTFRSVFSGLPLAGFALSPDGARVFVGNDDGVFAAATTDLSFSKVSDTPIKCLTATETTLYACVGDPRVPYALGASTDGGKTFTPVLTLQGVRGPLACPAASAAATCVADWPALRATLDPSLAASDAGASDGGADAGKLVAGGGCALHGPTSAVSGVLVGLALAIGAWARRQSQRDTRSL